MIKIVDDNDVTIETFDTVDEMFEKSDARWEAEHPILNWYDNMMYGWLGENHWIFFGYAPHVLLIDPIAVLRQLLHEIKWAYQRVAYGVDERASRGVGYWLTETMPKVLSRIKGSKFGTPFTFYNNIKSSYYPSESEIEEAGKKYDQTIIELLWAFNEMKKLEDFDVSQYKNIKVATAEYKKREKEAKKKLKLLIDYYWEIGD